MSIQETQAHVKSAIWKSLAQSDLDLSDIPEEKLDAVIDIATDAALQELDKEMDADQHAVALKEASAETDEGEIVLWEGRPFLSLTKFYRITTERLRVSEGLLSKIRHDIELVKIQELEHTQRFSERMLNLGDIIVTSHDQNHSRMILENVKDVQAVYEILRKAMRDARKQHNFSYREEM